MTKYSQNGFPACQKSLLAYYTVPNTGGLRMLMRRGVTATCLLYFVQRWDAEIEPISQLGCFACRDIIGSTTTSNHASGTAVDINWNHHPLASQPSAVLSAKVHKILNTRINGIRVGDVLRWGGDYHSRKDPMHVEINASLAMCQQLASAIVGAHPPVPPKPKPPVVEEITMFIIGRADEAEEYLSDGFQRKWIPDAKHRDDYLALGIKVTRNFNTEGGLNVVGGVLTGKDSPRKEALP